MMELIVNGDRRIVNDNITISQLLELFNIHELMVVVEHNGEIVLRAKFGETRLAGGDAVEIVQMMAGG